MIDKLHDLIKKIHPKFHPLAFKATILSFFLGAPIIVLIFVALPAGGTTILDFLDDMAVQPKGKAQMTYGKDKFSEKSSKLVERAPVKGTMPREFFPYRFIGKTEAEIEAANSNMTYLANPYDRFKESTLKGKKLYEINCMHCHGKDGLGDGPIQKRGVNALPLVTKTVRDYPNGKIYHIILEGRTVKKQVMMPAHKDKVSQDDAWHIVNYIRALQRMMNPKKSDIKGKK